MGQLFLQLTLWLAYPEKLTAYGVSHNAWISGFKAGIYIREVKINMAKPTVIKLPMETQRRKLNNLRFMNKHIQCSTNFNLANRDNFPI